LRNCVLSAVLFISALCLSGCGPAFRLAEDAGDGDLAAVKADIAAKTPVDAREGSGETALGFAASNGRVEVVRYLISQGADVNSRDSDFGGVTPLMLASGGKQSGRDYPNVIAALLAAGANVNAKDKWGSTAIEKAAMGGEPEVIPILVKAGADPNSTGAIDTSPLAWAAYDGDIPMMQALISAGANVNAVGNDGMTALAHASMHDQLSAVRFMIGAGADVNAAGPHGQTPLAWAASEGNVPITKALLEAGADPNLSGFEMPLKAARDGHHDDVAALLAQHGAHA
jgi:uncharacterized protein